MGLLLAPYNNAMRLGQGFNSYTQEICVDDAVIVDPGRPENPITNDGMTMTDLRAKMIGPSAYALIQPATELDKTLITAHYDDDDDVELEPKEERREPKPGKVEQKDEEMDEEEDMQKEEEMQNEDEIQKEEEMEEEEKMEEEEEEEKKTKDEKADEKAETKPGKGIQENGEEDEDEEEETTLQPEEERKAALERQRAASQKAEKEREAAEKAKEKEDEKVRQVSRKKAEEEEERRFEAARKRAKRAEAEKRATEAAEAIKPYTREEREAWLGKPTKTPSQPARTGMGQSTRQQYTYRPFGARGPSQIVTYSSRFVEKLSDITDDMNISGALSIKYGAIGGSGRGAFVNTDKFHESDLNFYISVKVINQTINMKDNLMYQPLRSVDSSNFHEVFGDCFISGFMEGGEFNALVSMKVLNKEQTTKIKAEAKVALTVGPAEISAEAAIDVAKANISNNTETTVQVSWSGGGFIKPIDEPWDINSLMSAAARFPDLVAITPQRTYAILTKYEKLRSFVKLRPASVSRMQYENAQLYTNMLMDTYMDYKTIMKRLSSDIFDIENGLKFIHDTTKEEDETALTKQGTQGQTAIIKKGGISQIQLRDSNDETSFPPSIAGLDQAKRAVRFQMVRIVNEVEEITRDPKLATDEDREEPFQPPYVFKARLPAVKPIEEDPSVPLRKDLIEPTETKSYGPLCAEFEELEDVERLALTTLIRDRPDASRYFRLTKPMGSLETGQPFNNINFLKFSSAIAGVVVGVKHGIVSSLQIQYENGLQCLHGTPHGQGTTWFNLKGLGMQERIIACSIETGELMQEGEPDEKPAPKKGERLDTQSANAKPRITALNLYTNRGRNLMAQGATKAGELPRRIADRDDRRFRNLTIKHFDPVMEKAFIKGFWGYSENGLFGSETDGIWRLGVVWGNELQPEAPKPKEEKQEEGKGKKAEKEQVKKTK